jgi:hypothetical protein
MVAIKIPADRVTLYWKDIVPLFNKEVVPLGIVNISALILMPLNPFQLEQISDEYYAKGFVLGRNALYIHMGHTYLLLHVTPLRNG